MTYDDWKLMVPPQFENDEEEPVKVKCTFCGYMVDEIHTVVYDNQSTEMCEECLNHFEENQN